MSVLKDAIPPERPRARRIGFAVALAGVGVFIGIRLALKPVLGHEAPLLLLTVPVAIAGYVGGLWPALLATAAAMALGTYFLIDPEGSLWVPHPVERARLVLFAVTGVIIGGLCESMHRARRRAEFASTAAEASDRAARRVREEQGQAAAALRESEENFRLLVQGVLDYAIFMVNPDGRIATWNEGARRLKGYAATEAVGRPISIFYEPDEVAKGHPGRNLRYAAEHGVYEGQGWRLRKDGSRFFADVAITALRDPAGTLRGFAKVTRDITDRRAAEEALRESAARAQAVFDTAVDGILVIDEAGKVESVNRSTERIFGYAAAELLGRNVSVLMPEPDQSRHDDYLRHYLATGERKIIGIGREVVGRRKDGTTFPLDLSVSEVRLGERRVFTGIVRDVTVRRHAEEEIRQLTESLERRVVERTAQLEEANLQLEAFAYSVSHDLRAPLRAVQGFAQALLEDYGEKLDETGREYARRAVGAAGDMDKLIRDLLEYSRLGRREIPLSDLPLAPVVRTAVAHLDGELAARGAAVDVEPGDCTVRGNAAVLGQVLANLLSNAAKFVRPGEVPRVRLDCQRLGDGFVRVNVHDNGIGVAPEHQKRIFNAFERLHGSEEYPGTGIGLAIVRRGAERMGGRFGLESAVGRGSTFWVDLPAAGEEVPAPPSGGHRTSDGAP